MRYHSLSSFLSLERNILAQVPECRQLVNYLQRGKLCKYINIIIHLRFENKAVLNATYGGNHLCSCFAFPPSERKEKFLNQKDGTVARGKQRGIVRFPGSRGRYTGGTSSLTAEKKIVNERMKGNYCTYQESFFPFSFAQYWWGFFKGEVLLMNNKAGLRFRLLPLQGRKGWCFSLISFPFLNFNSTRQYRPLNYKKQYCF